LEALAKGLEVENMSRFNYNGAVQKEVVDNFIEDQKAWLARKQEKIEELRFENENKKLEKETSSMTYKPVITKVSEMMARTKFDKIREKEVFNRLYNDHEENIRKKHVLQFKEIPKFHPEINKKLPNFLKNKNPGTNKNPEPSVSSLKYLGNVNTESNLSNFNKSKIINNESKKKSKLNNSAMEIYNDKNNSPITKLIEEEDEDDTKSNNYGFNYDGYFDYIHVKEDPIAAQYKIHLEKSHLNNSPVKQFIQSKARNINTFISKKIENRNEKDKISSTIFNELKSANDKYSLNRTVEKHMEKSQGLSPRPNVKIASPNLESKNEEFSYRLNIRNNTAWNKNQENKLYAEPKFSSIIKNLK
jgi:hypothetical protein